VIEAAEAVCAGESIDRAAVLDLIAQLVSKSLVLAEEHDGVDGYRMLEPIRRFAVELQAD
jgi:predicted ATPase